MWKKYAIVVATAMTAGCAGVAVAMYSRSEPPKPLSFEARWQQTMDDIRVGQEALRQAGHIYGYEETIPRKRWYDRVPELPDTAPRPPVAKPVKAIYYRADGTVR
jgi:hypothetical protein